MCLYLTCRCNGNGLKRGRPSMKSVDKYQCEKCHRNLWSQEQLQLHLTKCDGSHVERRGRKPGDNSCMVSLLNISLARVPVRRRVVIS